MKNFKALGVKADFIKALKELNISQPTEIQEKAISLLMEERTDLVAQAQTGTGKTIAFGIPLLTQVNPNEKTVQGLILCPTRELVQQVAKQLFRLTKYTDKIFIESVYGGERIEFQIANLRRPTQIIVATPGRLIDLLERKAVSLHSVKTVVLDEADEMLSMGFKVELNKILEVLPAVENKWLFSATIPSGIQDIISKHLSKKAQRIKVSQHSVVNQNISHQYVVVEEADKLYALQLFLQSEKENRGVIFCRTKAAAQTLAKQLMAKNLAVDAIHGDLLQKERDKVMRAFKNETLRLLVATDIAARGIDISGLSFVAHYQLPESNEYYTHRSGRTARAGKEGVSMCFINPKEMKVLQHYEKTLGIKFRQVK